MKSMLYFMRIPAASFMCAGFTYGFENVVVLTFCIVKCCIVGLNCLVKCCIVVLYNKEPEMMEITTQPHNFYIT